METNLKQIQIEQKEWMLKNFNNPQSWHYLLGATEELGKLRHAHLKNIQNIRTNENHFANKKDAIADTIIFLIGYCNLENIDIDKTLHKVWNQVKECDWIQNKINGNVNPSIGKVVHISMLEPFIEYYGLIEGIVNESRYIVKSLKDEQLYNVHKQYIKFLN